MVTLGNIVANIPTAAVANYATKDLLHLSNLSITGTAGAVAATSADGVQVVAYLGDAAAQGTLNTFDATDIARVATGLDSGFANYPLMDPTIVGSIRALSYPQGTDASLVNAYVGGAVEPLIPPQPFGGSVAPTGPDPALSVGTSLVAAPGATVTVPVNIDTARPDGSTGMMEAVLALQYDPQVFTVSAADVQLGALTQSGSGWHLTTVVNAKTGQIGVDLFSTTPILTTAGGSLVTISLHVRDAAPAGATALSVVTDVSPTGQHVFHTEVADRQGAFVLHATTTAEGLEPGAPGQLTVADNSADVNGLPALFTASPTGAVVNQSTFDVQPAAILTNIASSASALPLGLVEQVFGDLAETTQLVQENSLGQPGPVVSWETGDRTLMGVRDLALAPSGMAGPRDWVSDDYLTYLGQAAQRGVMASVPALLDGTASGTDEGDELAGLEAFFAREATGGNRSRMQ